MVQHVYAQRQLRVKERKCRRVGMDNDDNLGDDGGRATHKHTTMIGRKNISREGGHMGTLHRGRVFLSPHALPKLRVQGGGDLNPETILPTPLKHTHATTEQAIRPHSPPQSQHVVGWAHLNSQSRVLRYCWVG